MFGFDPVSVLAAGYMLASSGGCPAPLQEPVFELQIDQQQAVVDQSLSAGQITQLKLQGDQSAVTSGDAYAAASANRDAEVRQTMSSEGVSFYNGLTQGKLAGQTMYAVKQVPVGDGGDVCLYTDKVTLTLSYQPYIWIAAEYAARPCADKVVRAHEALHVEKDQLAIADFAPRAKESMSEFLSTLGGQGPYSAGEAAEGFQSLQGTIQGDLENAVLPALSLLRTQYQQGIDTPENYKMQSALCPAEDWLPEPPAQ